MQDRIPPSSAYILFDDLNDTSKFFLDSIRKLSGEGLVALRITFLTTDQKVAGSNLAKFMVHFV